MSIFADISHILLQAIINKLEGDAELSALISGIYVFAPPNAQSPYIIINQPSLQNVSSRGLNVVQADIEFAIFSSSSSIIETHDIVARLHQLLDDSLSLSPYNMLDVRFLQQQLNAKYQSGLRRSDLSFRLMLQ